MLRFVAVRSAVRSFAGHGHHRRPWQRGRRHLRGHRKGGGHWAGAQAASDAFEEDGPSTGHAQSGSPRAPADSREYGIGVEILVDLGVTTMRLMTNNPTKYGGLKGSVSRSRQRPTPVVAHAENIEYLRTNRERMGQFGRDSMTSSDMTQLVEGTIARFGNRVGCSRRGRQRDRRPRGLRCASSTGGSPNDCPPVRSTREPSTKVTWHGVTVAWAPGAFELPLVARALTGSGSVDAVVCLGAVSGRYRSLRFRGRGVCRRYRTCAARHGHAGRLWRAHHRHGGVGLGALEPDETDKGWEAAVTAIEMVLQLAGRQEPAFGSGADRAAVRAPQRLAGEDDVELFAAADLDVNPLVGGRLPRGDRRPPRDEVRILRPQEIPLYVAEASSTSASPAGTGSRRRARGRLGELGYSKATSDPSASCSPSTRGSGDRRPEDLEREGRIATEYPQLTQRWLIDHGVKADVGSPTARRRQRRPISSTRSWSSPRPVERSGPPLPHHRDAARVAHRADRQPAVVPTR